MRVGKKGEQCGVRQPEPDVGRPAEVEIREGIDGFVTAGLSFDVGCEHMLGDRIEQAVLVAEQSIDRRWLYSGRRRDSAGGDCGRPSRLQQSRSNVNDRGLSSVAADASALHRCHVPTITDICYRQRINDNVQSDSIGNLRG